MKNWRCMKTDMKKSRENLFPNFLYFHLFIWENRKHLKGETFQMQFSMFFVEFFSWLVKSCVGVIDNKEEECCIKFTVA